MVNEIRNRISSGSLLPGARLPSERRLSEEFGVSRLAVQTALRELEGSGLVMRQPNCRPIVSPSIHRKSVVATPAADQIAIWMLPEMQDIGGIRMLQGIRSVFGSHNLRLLIGGSPSFEREAVENAEIDFLNSLAGNPSIAGAIVWDTGTPGCERVHRLLRQKNFPLVFIDREPASDVVADVVSINNHRASRTAIRHLIELGHREIAMVVGWDHASSVTERIEGYRATLVSAGLTPNPEYLVEMPFEEEEQPTESAGRTLDRILALPEPPTAIFAVNDSVGLHILEAARQRGISVPGQLSLVGFDWLLRVLPSGGELTTVAQPFEEIGKAAAQRVLDRIASPGETPRQILFEGELVLKDTTGAPFDRSSSIDFSKFDGEKNETT